MPTKWITVFDPSSASVSEAIELNPEHIKKLATWLCDRTCSSHSAFRATEIRENDGYCDTCRDIAGFLLVDCPWIDMDRTEPAE